MAEVAVGHECGVVLEGWDDVREGDLLEAFEIETVAPVLGASAAG